MTPRIFSRSAAAAIFLVCLPLSPTHAGTLTVSTDVTADNPEILGYNVGHYVEGSNTQDWWRYAGVNGARMFLSSSFIEPNDDIPGIGDGVTDQASFLARKTALRASPLDPQFIDWPDFEDRYENALNGNSRSGNRFRPNFALGSLRELDIQVLVQITGSESSLPIADDDDWPGKWELWQHYYAQAFYLGRNFDVERYQMYNEPNHPNADGLLQENWLMRLQLASDAIQSALADVNALDSKSLTPLIYAPVNSGGDQYSRWGSVGVENRHTDFLGNTDPNYLVMHRYDYHLYNSSASQFANTLSDIQSAIENEMAPETPFPTSISEFNVHTNSTFDGLEDTLDDPELYARFGAISARLAQQGQDEFYCFKFAQTGAPDDNFPVTKNGTHYVQNGGEPYIYGGATRTAEIWRLFNKALKPGGSQLDFNRADDSNGSIDRLDIRVTFDPATQNYYIFSANEDGSTGITVDTSAWNLPEGTPFLVEEVSENRYGIGRTWNTISADGTLFDGNDNNLVQPSDTVWLITIPALGVEPENIIAASADATVTDGSSAGTNFSDTDTLLARNDPNSVNNRSAAMIQFDLPLVYAPDIQFAILTVSGKTGTEDVTAQGHIYGIDDDSWAETPVTWNNAPNLLKGAPAGNLIANRVIDGQGDDAQILGQLVLDRTRDLVRLIDVTGFLQEQSDHKASFLISQDPRWDVAIPSLATGDTQADGLIINSTENGTDAAPGPQLSLVRLQDSDGDGISDLSEEGVFSTDPTSADTDGDGFSDAEEALFYQTDPNDAASLFKIDEIEILPSGSPVIRWTSAANLTYDIDRSTDLTTDSWERIGSVTGTGGEAELEDTNTGTLRRAFYRMSAR